MVRMYNRWAEQHGYKVQLLEESEGETAGIKSATLQVSGPDAYGWLKTKAEGAETATLLSSRATVSPPTCFTERCRPAPATRIYKSRVHPC
jgi:protein subunit release factor B